MAARHGTISPTLRAGVPFWGGLRGGGGGLAVVVCTHPCAGGVAGGSSVRHGRKNPVASPGPVGPFEEEPRIRRGGLRYMVWYGMVWYGMVWYGMVWYGMVWYGIWYGMVWYGMAWHGTARHGTARHGTARHGTARHGTVRHGMVWYGMVWCGMALPPPLLSMVSKGKPRTCLCNLAQPSKTCVKFRTGDAAMEPMPFLTRLPESHLGTCTASSTSTGGDGRLGGLVWGRTGGLWRYAGVVGAAVWQPGQVMSCIASYHRPSARISASDGKPSG